MSHQRPQRPHSASSISSSASGYAAESSERYRYSQESCPSLSAEALEQSSNDSAGPLVHGRIRGRHITGQYVNPLLSHTDYNRVLSEYQRRGMRRRRSSPLSEARLDAWSEDESDYYPDTQLPANSFHLDNHTQRFVDALDRGRHDEVQNEYQVMQRHGYNDDRLRREHPELRPRESEERLRDDMAQFREDHARERLPRRERIDYYYGRDESAEDADFEDEVHGPDALVHSRRVTWDALRDHWSPSDTSMEDTGSEL
ncbi:hypothetical protein PV11_01977 [Exophiala sideris]|uniref:Uncharacterized protein n=1 Tax=Exophiala sideris TaxID=1016849 RepID=A0A0D1ZHP8_9EURO|nr:hypothetical protein PV11_01977 [Exophiala sideris]